MTSLRDMIVHTSKHRCCSDFEGLTKDWIGKQASIGKACLVPAVHRCAIPRTDMRIKASNAVETTATAERRVIPLLTESTAKFWEDTEHASR